MFAIPRCPSRLMISSERPCLWLLLFKLTAFGSVLCGQPIDTVYVDPQNRFVVVLPKEQVAGLDIELWSARAQARHNPRSHPDTTTLQFFLPESRKFTITIRAQDRLLEIKAGMLSSDIKGFQCLPLPNRILQTPVDRLIALGRVDPATANRVIPISWNAQPRDSLSLCEFFLKPNKDIKERHEFLREVRPNEWEVVMPMSVQRFHPGQTPFKIVWNGSVNGRPGPEGNYKLCLQAEVYKNKTVVIEEFIYEFYNKPVFTSCSQASK